MLERGELPALSRMIDQGVMGRLASLHPVAPIISWNTIATGMTPDKHGILGAFEPDPESGRLRPVTGKSRRAKALWQITSEAGLRTHVAGWIGAAPAEEVRGVFIAPQFAAEPVESSVNPPELLDRLKDLRMQPSEVPADALLSLVPRAREIDQRRDHRLSRIASGLAACCSMHNAATWILGHHPWDFAAISYHAIGYFCEGFMPYHAPRLRNIQERDFELYRDVVSGIYGFHDLMLARLIELAGDDAIVVLVSVNGYQPGRLAAGDCRYTDHGILCVKGPGIRRDELVRGANILDVAPTILTLLGLPISGEMDGKIIADAFIEIPHLERASRITSSAQGFGLAGQFVQLEVEQQSIAEQSAAEDLRFNLVSVFMSTGRPETALPVIEKLFEAAPEDLRYQRAFAQCLLATGKLDRAERLLQNLLAGHETHSWMHYLMGVLCMHRKHVDDAMAHFRKAEQSATPSAAIHALIGNVYLAKRMWKEAAKSFANALAIDSEHAAAHTGMSAVKLRQRRPQEAADHALQAINLSYEIPAAHYQLGLAMMQMRRYDRAAVALEAALALAPEMTRARRWLSTVRGMLRPA